MQPEEECHKCQALPGLHSKMRDRERTEWTFGGTGPRTTTKVHLDRLQLCINLCSYTKLLNVENSGSSGGSGEDRQSCLAHHYSQGLAQQHTVGIQLCLLNK